MGIKVNDKVVEHDDSHSRRVVTSLEKCPTVGSTDGMPVHFVFRRVKERGHSGDGNPLIYALKGLQSYQFVDGHRGIILERAREIIGKLECDFDGILACPSSNSFNAEFATLLSEVLGVDLIDSSWMAKTTIKDAITELEAVFPELQGAKRHAAVKQLNAWRNSPGDSLVSMKLVDQKVRSLVKPIVPQTSVDLSGKSHILVADDLMASGATLRSAMHTCLANGAQNVSGICFMSRLKS